MEELYRANDTRKFYEHLNGVTIPTDNECGMVTDLGAGAEKEKFQTSSL